MKIINSRQDINALPENEKADWLIRLAATIYQQNADGETIADTSTIERFGYTLEDFPEAPVLPHVEPPIPPITIPTTVRAWQAKAVLSLAGILEAAEAAINSMPEPQRTIVASAWANNSDFSRDSQTIASLAVALGLTPEQLDAMFLQATDLAI